MGTALWPRDIELLCLDVDGVLTDGSIILNERGEETKRYSVRDGLAIRAWLGCGLHLAVITARPIGPSAGRLESLGVTHIYSDVVDKGAVFASICTALKVDPSHAAMVGDDLADLAVFRRCGCPVAVGDAVEEIKDAARVTTTAVGGRGAVRETVEGLLKAAGLWAGVVQKFDVSVEGV